MSSPDSSAAPSTVSAPVRTPTTTLIDRDDRVEHEHDDQRAPHRRRSRVAAACWSGGACDWIESGQTPVQLALCREAPVNRSRRSSQCQNCPRSRAPCAACAQRSGRQDDRDGRVLHPALKRRLSPARLRSLRGARVARVERRGKHQLFLLDDGRVLHAHFRMTGDWTIDRAERRRCRASRAPSIDFTDGTRVVLDDPRALSTLDLHAPRRRPISASAPSRGSVAHARTSLLAALVEEARTDQTGAARSARHRGTRQHLRGRVALACANLAADAGIVALTPKQVASLLAAIRQVIKRATGARYTDSSVSRLAVYDREGKPCRRCGTTIERIVQAGRSTYYCPTCQR